VQANNLLGMATSETLPLARPRRRSMESVLVHRWARVLIPSLSDLFFLAILVWLFMSSGGAGWQGLLADADLGWHIRTGEYILSTHTIPHQDLYSFSKPGAPWYAWEWLTDVLAAGLHSVAGLKGIVLAAGVLISIFATSLIRRMALRGANIMVGLAVALLGVGAASIHFLARPHILTLVLLSISVWIIESDREHGSRRIWWLIPLTIVWTNLHGGFLALIAVLGLTTIGTALEAWLGGGGTIRNAVRYALLTAACAAASLVNPYGWKLHIHVKDYLQSGWIRNVVQEFQSPSFRTENMLQFEVLLLVGMMVAAALFRRRRIVEGLWIAYWAHMALGSVRHVPVFVAVTTPILAVELSSWWTTVTASAKKSSLAGILNQIAADCLAGFRRSSVWPAVVVFALVCIGAPIPWPRDFPDVLFPTAMVHTNLDLIAKSRILTTDQWGDYLIYTDPRLKVFVDGRSDFYGPEVGGEYLRLIGGQWDWQQIMEKYQFDLALLPTQMSITQLLKLAPGWHVLQDDGKRVLLARTPTSVLPTGNSPSEPRF
jgi:hypothetical protein